MRNLNDFYLHIDYIDRENNLKSKIDEMDDLLHTEPDNAR
jgi:hypothetical protein